MQYSLWLGGSGSDTCVPSACLSASPDKGLPRSAESFLLSLKGAGRHCCEVPGLHGKGGYIGAWGDV